MRINLTLHLAIGMTENPPKRKMPDFEIGKERMNDLKTVAAVTKVLSEDPKLAEELSRIFKEVAMEKERELMERVTALLAEKVPDVQREKIEAAFDYWYVWYFPPEAMRFVWTTGWRCQPLIHWR